MQYDEFVGAVQSRARLPSKGDAVAAIRATLETLGERITNEEADHLAAQLPREIALYVTRAETPRGRARSFPLSEFFRRVCEREPTDPPHAAYHARVVMEVLGSAVSAGEMADVRAQLSDDYQPLFEAGSSGRWPASAPGEA